MYDFPMHRTQLILEERQYRALITRARRESKSLSALVREAVDGLLEVKSSSKKKYRLQDMKGIFHGTGEFSGRDHDKVLYSHPVEIR